MPGGFVCASVAVAKPMQSPVDINARRAVFNICLPFDAGMRKHQRAVTLGGSALQFPSC